MEQVQLLKSTRKDKKYMAIFYNNRGEKIKTVHFGAAGASDYTINKDDARKERYLKRHSKNENWNNYKSAGSLSRWILWNKPILEDSYKNYIKRFNLKKK